MSSVLTTLQLPNSQIIQHTLIWVLAMTDRVLLLMTTWVRKTADTVVIVTVGIGADLLVVQT